MLTLKNCPNQMEKLFRDFGFFCMNHLQIKNELVIVEFDDLADGMNGALVEYGENGHFLIWIDNKPDRGVQQMLVTLAHELTHVMQCAKKGLTQDAFETDVPYLERWWEVEAIEVSRALANEFAKRKH